MAADKYKEFEFSWRGKNDDGKIISGEHTASSKAQVKAFLLQNHITPIKIQKTSKISARQFYSKIPKRDILLLLQNIAYSLQSGVNLSDVLEIMLDSENNGRIRPTHLIIVKRYQ